MFPSALSTWKKRSRTEYRGVGREEQGEGETHGKEQSEEQRSKEQNAQPLIMDYMRMG